MTRSLIVLAALFTACAGDSDDPMDTDNDGTEVDTEMDSEVDNDDDSDLDTDGDSDQDTDSDTEMDTDSDTEMDTDVIPDCAVMPVPLAYMPLDGTTDDQTGMSPTTPVGSASYIDGVVGDAMTFGGLAGFKIDDPTPFMGDGPRSFEAWVKTPASTTNQAMFTHYECGGICNNNNRVSLSLFQVLLNADGHVAFSVRSASSNDVSTVEGTTDVADDTWHHVAAIVDGEGSYMRVLVDGVQEGFLPVQLAEVSPFNEDGDGEVDSLDFGARRAPGASFLQFPFLGAMDEVALYDVALLNDELTALVAAADGRCPLPVEASE